VKLIEHLEPAGNLDSKLERLLEKWAQAPAGSL